MHLNFMGKPLDGFSDFATIVAAQGAVLLKNDHAVLPLRPDRRCSLAVVVKERLRGVSPRHIR